VIFNEWGFTSDAKPEDLTVVSIYYSHHFQAIYIHMEFNKGLSHPGKLLIERNEKLSLKSKRACVSMDEAQFEQFLERVATKGGGLTLAELREHMRLEHEFLHNQRNFPAIEAVRTCVSSGILQTWDDLDFLTEEW
jgi:predicted RNA methylase